MKKLVLLVLILSCLQSYGQGWQTVKLDSAVSFQLPQGYKKAKSDTASSFSASTAFGTILIFKANDNPVVTPDIERDKHLTDYYNDYIDRVKSSSASDGKILNEKDTLLGELRVKDFTLQIDTGSGVEMRKFRILHANNATYAFEFLFEEMHKEYAAAESDKFFNSIKVNEQVLPADQFTAVNDEKSGTSPYFIGAAILAAIALIAFLFMRKKKVVS